MVFYAWTNLPCASWVQRDPWRFKNILTVLSLHEKADSLLRKHNRLLYGRSHSILFKYHEKWWSYQAKTKCVATCGPTAKVNCCVRSVHVWEEIRKTAGGRNNSLVVFRLAVHSVAGSILLWGHFPVGGIFPLELTWVQTPFPPKTLSDESINRGLVCAHMHFIART